MQFRERTFSMTPFIVSLAFFMEFVDSTAINTAIPAMAKSLLVEPVDLKVALISYLLSLAIFIPISGWLADKYGAKKVFIIALIIFSLSSLWCGLADSLMELILARFIQGFGGALGLPVGRLIIAQSFKRHQLIMMMSRVVMVGSLGMMLGPVIGGLITFYFSWHWIFWVNIPVGAFTIVLAICYLKPLPKQSTPPLDKLGFILFGSSLAGIVFGMSALSESIIDNWISVSIIGFSCLLLVLYFIYSRNAEHPIVKTSLFSLRTFKLAAIGNLVSRLGFSGLPFLLPLMLQISYGYSAQISGLMVAPIALGLLISKPIFLPLLRRAGYKRLLIINTFFAGFSLFLFSFVTEYTSLYTICALTFTYGLLLSLQYSSLNSLAYAEIPSDSLSSATSITSTLQQLSQSFGVAVSALFIRFFSRGLPETMALNATVFHHTFCAISLLTLATTFVFLRLRKEDGEQMLFMKE